MEHILFLGLVTFGALVKSEAPFETVKTQNGLVSGYMQQWCQCL